MASVKSLVVRLVCGVVAFLVFVPAALAAGPTFNDPGFANTWNRVDKPLLDLPGGIGRGYNWGPAIPQAAQVTQEAYNGGQRTVQYFDKARMEVNNPGGNPNDLFYVTTGLLVKELVTGKRQDGDNSFSQQQPSEVQVAGDTNEFGGNAVAPTYASFQSVGTFGGTENGRPSQQGQTVNERISRAGQVTSFTPPEQRLLTGYDPVTQHNIPDVFVNFANMEGLVWNGSAFVNGKVLFDNPLYVLGRPLTEPYWVRAAVRGLEQDVLVQLFERRVLTYTLANAEGFKVEMGNVGQHYYRWRYSAPQPTLTKTWEIGRDPNAMFQPSGIAVDTQGNSFVLTRNNIPIQKYDASGKLVKTWGNASGLNYPSQVVLDSQGNPFVYFGKDNQIVKYDNNGNLLAKIGSSGNGSGQFKRLTTFGFDLQDTLYAVDGDSFTILKYNNQGQFIGSIDLNNSLTYFRNNQQGQLGNSILVDGQGHIFLIGAYYQSQSNQKGGIFKFDSQGKLLFTWNDPNFSAQYATLDSLGNLFVTSNVKVGKLDNNLKVLTSWPVDYGASALAVDKQGMVYLPYSNLNLVKKYDSTGKFLISFGSYAQGNGPLGKPGGLALDNQGNIYVSDSFNARIQKFNPTGQYLLQFGTIGESDGQFQTPGGIVVDSKGNIYVVDLSRRNVQKFDATGKFLVKWSTFPGESFIPFRLAIDGLDNIYIFAGDQRPILKLDTEGKLLAQIGFDSSNNYLFHLPVNLAVDHVLGQAGKLYVLDSLGSLADKTVVREFDSNGNLILNLGTQSGAAGLDVSGPVGMAVDKYGFVYIVDSQGRIKKYSPNGELAADWAAETYSDFTPVDIRNLSVDDQGNLLALDFLNDRLLKLHQG